MRHISPLFLHRKGSKKRKKGKSYGKMYGKNYILLQLYFMMEVQNSKYWTSALPQGKG